MTTAAKTQIHQLIREIRLHDYNYHVLDSPTIGDGQYDQLVRKLIALETDFPEYRDQTHQHNESVRNPNQVLRKLHTEYRCYLWVTYLMLKSSDSL